jgi:hypothetical protein
VEWKMLGIRCDEIRCLVLATIWVMHHSVGGHWGCEVSRGTTPARAGTLATL